MHGLAPLPRPNLLRCNTIRGLMPLLALCFAHSPWGWAPFADLPLPRRRRIPLRRGPLAATVVGLARASRRVPMRARRRGRAACAACRATNPIVSTTVPLCAIPRHHVAAIRTREVSRGSGKAVVCGEQLTSTLQPRQRVLVKTPQRTPCACPQLPLAPARRKQGLNVAHGPRGWGRGNKRNNKQAMLSRAKTFLETT